MKYLIVSIHDAAPPFLEYLSMFGHRVMRKIGLFRFPFPGWFSILEAFQTGALITYQDILDLTSDENG